jgi:Tol biopolymer transport system component
LECTAPDGQTIAYTRIAEQGWPNRDIFLIDVETLQETQVTALGGQTDPGLDTRRAASAL